MAAKPTAKDGMIADALEALHHAVGTGEHSGTVEAAVHALRGEKPEPEPEAEETDETE